VALRGRSALVCYAMKANSNLAVIDILARRGAGFDIVSGGELERVLAAGGDPGKTVFSGVARAKPRSSGRSRPGSFASTSSPRPNSNASTPWLVGSARARGSRSE